MQDAGDAALRRHLIETYRNAQSRDGSWDGDIANTARSLRDLAALGAGRKSSCVGRGVSWLLAKRPSRSCRATFRLTDALAIEPVCAQSPRGRARARRHHVAIPARTQPCGGPVRWPNALVLETLLALGLGREKPVRDVLQSISLKNWPECGNRLGSPIIRGRLLPTAAELRVFEAACVAEYRYGGVRALDEIAATDLTKEEGVRVLRTAQEARGGHRVYHLETERHLRMRDVVTTRAVSRATNRALRRFAEAHLWRFAACQDPIDGTFMTEDDPDPQSAVPAMLDVFARYDSPIARSVILRALPWITTAQNADGSWGAETNRDAATYAVLNALHRVRDHLPEAFVY
jgi:hypothetical protein